MRPSYLSFGMSLLLGWAALGAAGCGSDSDGQGASGGSPGGGGSSSQGSEALSCMSRTWCASGSVLEYGGQAIGKPAGGAIPDGTYRLGYVLSPKGSGTSFGDYANGFVIQGTSILDFTLGTLGTFKTEGSNLILERKADCNSRTGERDGDDSGSETWSYSIDASGNFHRFSEVTSYGGAGGPEKWTKEEVYVPVQSLCGYVTEPPSQPGDSFYCDVTNCGCTEGVNKPADPDICKFVSGG